MIRKQAFNRGSPGSLKLTRCIRLEITVKKIFIWGYIISFYGSASIWGGKSNVNLVIRMFYVFLLLFFVVVVVFLLFFFFFCFF